MVKSQSLAKWMIVVIIALIAVCLLAIYNLPKDSSQPNSTTNVSDEAKSFNDEVDALQSTETGSNTSVQNNSTSKTTDGSPADVSDTTINTYDRRGGEFDER